MTQSALRVLVVDDEPDTRETTAMLIRLWGHDVRTAGTGATALDLAGTYRPEVLLLDLALPGMDGYTVCRQLRQRTDIDQPVVISLSGYTREIDRQRALEAGCDQHWIKPCEPGALERLLAERRRAEGRQPSVPASGGC